MTKSRRLVLGIGAFLFGAIEFVILVDKLGQKHWFWPNDDSVFTGGIVLGVIGAIFFKVIAAPIEQEYHERLKREDYEE